MAKNLNKRTVVALAEQLIAGTSKHLANQTLTFASGSHTPAEVTAQLQKVVTRRSDVETAKATAKAKLAAEKADMPALRDLLNAYVSFVKVTFSKSPDVLADFGLTPKKATTPLTVVQKAAAAAKRKATRAARHTMGTQQKKGVKGAVTGVVVTPVTAAVSVTTATNGTSAPATSTDVSAGTTPHVVR
jgi:hypothetical protein